ncbi:CopG family transcriptional regulator [Duganella aceris]|uniref:CopG family transcriptional regulator n=1 Tax=Duganella aceris TaxID=2703883 RepID=A0ABX0FU63_9BURK|nr:CopG family transcriptional regulator [Duganella aceris]NGZ87953.1 CopG family transcriptional regulator [Duganella aceris]
MAMTLSEIEAGIKLLSLQEKKHVLQSLLSEVVDAKLDLRDLLTIEAMEDIDNGNFVEHQDVLAWANSLGTASPLPLPVPKKK